MNENTSQRIRAAARDQLAKVGAATLSLDAVSAAAGLAVQQTEAVFPTRDDLLTALIIHAYDSSAAEMERADQEGRTADAGPGRRLLAAARALRAWAFAHQAEFALIYGSPVPGYHAPAETVPPASRTPAVLAGILSEALQQGRLSPPPRQLPGPPLITEDAIALFGSLPPAPFTDLIERGIVLWSGLIGLLVFQVFSRTHDSVRDQDAFFDYAVAVIAESVGITVSADRETPSGDG